MPEIKKRKFKSFIGLAVHYQKHIWTINFGHWQFLILTGPAKQGH